MGRTEGADRSPVAKAPLEARPGLSIAGETSPTPLTKKLGHTDAALPWVRAEDHKKVPRMWVPVEK